MWHVGTHTYGTVWVLWKVADVVVLTLGHLAQALFTRNALLDDDRDRRHRRYRR